MKSQSILLFLLIATFQLSAQNVLTLDMALDKALENNYNIKIARNNKEIADNNENLEFVDISRVDGSPIYKLINIPSGFELIKPLKHYV